MRSHDGRRECKHEGVVKVSKKNEVKFCRSHQIREITTFGFGQLSTTEGEGLVESNSVCFTSEHEVNGLF